MTGLVTMTYSAEQTKASGSNFYAAFLLLPPQKRRALDAVYAFCRYSDDIVDEESDLQKAADELQAWRAELESCFKRQPRHPIMRDLADHVFEVFPVRHEDFIAIVDGCEMDLHTKRYETFADLQIYCERVASAVGYLCIEIFGYQNPHTREYAHRLGIALQLTNILRDVGSDTQRDRIYLPLEDLRRFHVTEQDILNHQTGSGFFELMEFNAERAECFYQEAIQIGRSVWTANLFPAEVMGQIYHTLLNRIRTSRYDVFGARPRISKFHKLKIALSLYVRTVLLGKQPWPNAAS